MSVLLLAGRLAVAQVEQPNTTTPSGTAAQPLPESPPYANAKSKPAGANWGLVPVGADPQNHLFLPFAKHLVQDQKQFWTSPFHLQRGDAKYGLPFIALTGALMASDSWISRQVPDSPSQLKRSNDFSNYATFALIGAAGTSFAWGHLKSDDHASEAGLLAAEAAINSTAAAFALKTITQRPRPMDQIGSARFFEGGGSFPSEHSALAWSTASVLAHEYPGTFPRLLFYGLASGITISRVTAKQHFASDVLVGGALGWYLGRQVYRRHHDPEVGGAAWGSSAPEPGTFEKHKWAAGQSLDVPLDSWVYPALDRLAALGYIDTAVAGIKPWSRMECARLTEEAGEALDGDASAPTYLLAAQARLRDEFADESNRISGGPDFGVKLESVYARAVSISGSALTDSYHFGQTVDYDFGRPFRRGTNGQIGASWLFAAGPMAAYVRAEFQHAPAAPALSDAVRNVIADRDQVPLAPGTPFDAVNRPRLLDAYLAFNVKGFRISAGNQSLSWGPGVGGSMIWSDNAEPVTMVRITKVEPSRLPSILGILGPAQTDQFIGRLEGHSYIPHPLIYGQKINFKPIRSLEIGFGRTVTLGGKGGDPFTAGNFIRSFFGQVDKTRSVPGDAHSSMDWTFRVPGVHDYIVFYGEVYADDDFIPWQNPPKNAYRPGIYITRFPGIPKLDFHMEAASTESPGFFNFGSTNRGNLNYWNQQYRDGYTNNGNLIGNSVGRMGRSIQAWLTYSVSPNSTLQFAYKHSSVSADFIPGGGAWQDYQARYDHYSKSGLYFKNRLQLEHISRYPILFDSPRTNLTAVIEFGWTLGHRH